MTRRISPASLWRQGRLAVSRLGWGVMDQAMASLTNFLLSVYVARSLGATQFGAFSLTYVTYGFALNWVRGLSIEPLLIRFSHSNMKVWRRAVSRSTGTALLVGLFTGTCALAGGALIGGVTGQAFIALGLVLPALMLQESWRFAFFAVGKGYHTFINDSVWAAVQVPALVVLQLTGHANVFWFVIAWGTGALVSSVLGAFQARVVPSLIGATSWLIAHRDLGPRFLAENAGGNAAGTLQSYGISSLLGLTAVGVINAAGVLMGPFKIIYFGIGLITIPEGAKLLRRSPRQLPRFCVMVSFGLSVLATAWAAVLLIALPLGLGDLMMGSIWRPAYPLVIPTALTILAACASTGASIGLHSMGAARRSMRSTLISAVISATLAIVGAAVWGIYGTVLLAAVGGFIGAAISWHAFVMAMQESGKVQIPRWIAVSMGGRRAAGSQESATTASWTSDASHRPLRSNQEHQEPIPTLSEHYIPTELIINHARRSGSAMALLFHPQRPKASPGIARRCRDHEIRYIPAAVRDARNTKKKPVIIVAIMAGLALGGCSTAGSHSVSTDHASSTTSASPGAAANGSATGTAPPTSTPTASSAPPTSAPVQSAHAGSPCVSSATNGLCNYSEDPAIVGAASRPWVGQNIWSGDKSYKQTLYSSAPGNWYVIANANTHFGGVLTYPNTGFYMTGAVASYSSITSSFGTAIPDNARTAGWAAYDLWFNDWHDEVMIQTDVNANSFYDCTPKTTATIAGQPWHMCVFGAERVWKPGPNDQHLLNRTSGTIDIQAFLTWMEQHGYLPASSTWTAASYGFEICDTGGTNETFRVNAFSWTAHK
jgi:O-antigen/teichoic acid export membrane protein